ncbi:hypothetical protein [Cobetia sp. 1AS1]|uniref:hypothetical protein n=1 Tax=Cobetia sp. 1AS1 TaxID=3040016 RepID=UPI00244949C2|nr:hypothetical protein [Cobetia sp. 1AS1]MDH2293443.1 hypothetical protein [Cobetia sp. 1AS1]
MTSNSSHTTPTPSSTPHMPSVTGKAIAESSKMPETSASHDSSSTTTSENQHRSPPPHTSNSSTFQDSSTAAAYRRGQLIKQHFQQWLKSLKDKPTHFTKVSCRNELMKHPELAGYKPIIVLQRVGDLIDRLVIDGHAVQSDTIGKRRRVYQLIDNTSAHSSDVSLPSNRQGIATSKSDGTSLLPLDEALQEQRRALKKSMRAAKAEAEHLYQLAKDYPEAKSDIASLQDDAIQRACELQGQLAAVLALSAKRHAGGAS